MAPADAPTGVILSLIQSSPRAGAVEGSWGGAVWCCWTPHCPFLPFQASNKVEVDMEKAESLRVTRGDFFASLENDIKPVSGHWGLQEQPQGSQGWEDPLGSHSTAASCPVL